MTVRRFLILLSIILIFGFIIFCYAKLVESRNQYPWQLDFAKFHISAQAFFDGDDIYRRVPSDYYGPLGADAEDAPETLHPNLNLPFVTILFAPFGLIDLATGMAIWTALSIGFTLAAAWLLGREIAAIPGAETVPYWIIAGVLAIALLISYPNWISAALGQLGQLLLLVLSAAWIFARRKHDRMAGFLFGFALVLKPFTGLFLLLFPWLRRWTLIQWYIVSALLFVAAGAAIAGPESYLRYFAGLQQVDWHAYGWNASIMAPLTAILGGSDGASVYNFPDLRQPIWLAVSGTLYGILVVAIRGLEDDQEKLDIAVAGGIPLMLLISPLGWVYYFSVVWISGTAVLSITARSSHRIRWILSTLLILVLSGIPYPFLAAGKVGGSYENILATSGDTGTLFLALLLVVCAARQRRRDMGFRYESRANIEPNNHYLSHMPSMARCQTAVSNRPR